MTQVGLLGSDIKRLVTIIRSAKQQLDLLSRMTL